jgi:hypothetical protein
MELMNLFVLLFNFYIPIFVHWFILRLSFVFQQTNLFLKLMELVGSLIQLNFHFNCLLSLQLSTATMILRHYLASSYQFTLTTREWRVFTIGLDVLFKRNNVIKNQIRITFERTLSTQSLFMTTLMLWLISVGKFFEAIVAIKVMLIKHSPDHSIQGSSTFYLCCQVCPAARASKRFLQTTSADYDVTHFTLKSIGLHHHETDRAD